MSYDLTPTPWASFIIVGASAELRIFLDLFASSNGNSEARNSNPHGTMLVAISTRASIMMWSSRLKVTPKWKSCCRVSRDDNILESAMRSNRQHDVKSSHLYCCTRDEAHKVEWNMDAQIGVDLPMAGGRRHQRIWCCLRANELVA